jgi:hypothetical protein
MGQVSSEYCGLPLSTALPPKLRIRHDLRMASHTLQKTVNAFIPRNFHIFTNFGEVPGQKMATCCHSATKIGAVKVTL